MGSGRRILLVGPPAAGKSAIVGELVKCGANINHHANLDDEVLSLCRQSGISGELADDVVDLAVSRFLERHKGSTSIVLELPYHDYIRLFRAGLLKYSEFDAVVAVTASFRSLCMRNASRQFVVPTDYIARCLGATHALCQVLDSCGVPWIVCDSDILSSHQCAHLIRDFVRRTVSASLSKLAIAPVPERPYLGGHLIADVEWDEQLLGKLRQRYSIRTALDVGCGLGLSLERFQRNEIQAWGVEGNPSVLSTDTLLRERIFIVDFTKQWVQWPVKVDLVWCVEVLEHVPQQYESNVLRTIAENTDEVAVVTAAAPGQPGYCHLNCQPKQYWIDRLGSLGLSYVDDSQSIFDNLEDSGAFGRNVFKDNGMLFQRTGA